MTLLPPIQTPSGDAIGPPEGPPMLVDEEAGSDGGGSETAEESASVVTPMAAEEGVMAEPEELAARTEYDGDAEGDAVSEDVSAERAEEEASARDDTAEEDAQVDSPERIDEHDTEETFAETSSVPSGSIPSEDVEPAQSEDVEDDVPRAETGSDDSCEGAADDKNVCDSDEADDNEAADDSEDDDDEADDEAADDDNVCDSDEADDDENVCDSDTEAEAADAEADDEADDAEADDNEADDNEADDNEADDNEADDEAADDKNVCDSDEAVVDNHAAGADSEADDAEATDEVEEADGGAQEAGELPPARRGFQRRTGPLEPAADAAGIVERLWRRVGKEPPPTLASFPAILEDIADVGGSVMMAGVVNAGIPPQNDTPKVDDGRWLIAHVQAQLDAMDRFVTRRLDAPFGPRNGLPSLEKAQAALMSEVLSEDARERAVTDLSRAFGQRLLALMRIVRRDGNRIRADLGPELRSLGGRAAYLERLDTSLRRATAHEMAARDVVLGELVSECAQVAMTEDLASADASDLAQGAILVERWYRRGFVRSLRTDIDGLVRAFAAEERALLTHLANAAIQPAAGEAA